jgi:hypothetical protein
VAQCSSASSAIKSETFLFLCGAGREENETGRRKKSLRAEAWKENPPFYCSSFSQSG